jgi:hypothetical protein
MKAISAVSTNKDAYGAGKEAVEEIIRKLSRRPDMLWVFGAISYNQERLLAGIQAVAPGIPLVGCTTDGEISSAGVSQESVVVLGLACDDIQFHTASATSLSQDSYQAGVGIGEAFKDSRCRYIQIFSDGLTGNAGRIIEGIQGVLGKDIVIAGGTSGDGGMFIRTFQYYHDKVLTDSIVAVAFTGNFSVGTGIGCGWFPVGTAKLVTKSDGNVLYELDGLPALQVYEKFLGRYASQLPAVGVEYPLGLLRSETDYDEDGYFLCRATMGVDREKKSIIFAGDIPEGSLVKMTMGNENDVIEAARKAAVNAVAEMKANSADIQAEAVFLYSCMARKIVLGSRTKEEVSEIRKIVGDDIPIIGFYSYGEYAPLKNQENSCFHNETVTMSIVGRQQHPDGKRS